MTEALRSANQATCFALLSARRLAPVIDGDERIWFRFENRNYVVCTPDDDPMFFFLCAPNLLKPADETEHLQALAAMSAVNARCAPTKLFQDNGVHASIGLLLTDADALNSVFDEALPRLAAGVEEFLSEMWKERRRTQRAVA